jgi:cation diffusion facilitator family transporter
MLTKWLIKKFIPESLKNNRQRYGYLSGGVGIVVNLSLFIIKFIIGLLINSVSITADAFNNLSDLGSSIVTIFGFKIADKPADKDHPFGHGRGEYIAGLVVSFMVMIVGFQFIKTSADRIIHPYRLTFELTSFLILVLSIGVKAWLGGFYTSISKIISSGTLNATSFDSYSDVIITTCVAVSFLISKFTVFPIDGYIGILVSLFIMYSGYKLIKDTISPLLGEAPDPQLVKGIISDVLSHEYIIGVHDVIIHSYGAGKYISSLHAEIPASVPVMKAHEIIDRIEYEVSKKYEILLVIHMDPVNTDDKEIINTKQEIENILNTFAGIESIHDFRIVGEGLQKNLLFDIVVTNTIKNGKEKELLDEIKSSINSKYPGYNLKISVDRDFSRM